MSLCQPVIWSMAAMLRDSAVVVVAVRTRPRAIPLAMITMKKSTHGFPFVSHIHVWDAYGAPLGGPSSRRKLRCKVCIPNVVIVGFLGFASQVAPYVNSSVVFFF